MTRAALCARSVCLIALDAAACSCITTPLKLRFLRSDVVVVGRFTDSHVSGYNPPRAAMTVTERFLGPAAADVQFEVAGGLCSTSYPFAGREALVFAERREGRLFEIGCASLTADRSEYAGEIRSLRRRAWWWRLERRLRRAARGQHVP